MMKKSYSSLIISFILLAVTIVNGVQGAAMVSGTVFCDQCKDGQVSMFDYPLSGVKVTMVCPGSDGQMTKLGEDTTNMMGGYSISLDGMPNLTNCFAQISPSNNGPGSNNSCGASTGPPKSVRLMFTLFGMSMYMVDPLISQPAQPMSQCSRSSSSPPSTSTPVTQPPPVASTPPPADPVTPVSPSTSPKAPSPAFKLPPFPPAPFVQETACPYEYWMKPEYKCYWRAVNQDLPVALVFGPQAAEKYGTDMTLYKGLQGKGDPYRTLLRESVTALLNSYNSLQFSYNALEVLHHFNSALAGNNNRTILITALKFKRANSGHGGQVPCKLTSCH